MSNALVSHNADISRLVDKGYAVAFDDLPYVIVRDIPYLDNERRLQTGAIVSKFVDVGQDRIIQENHEIFFAGSVPHNESGKPIPNLAGGPTTLALSEKSKDVVVQRSFSNKPMVAGKKVEYADFFEKIDSYVTIISGPALSLHRANPYTFRVVDSGPSDSPFKVRDTLTSRAEIGDLSAKFKNDIVAVIGVGVGGTGVIPARLPREDTSERDSGIRPRPLLRPQCFPVTGQARHRRDRKVQGGNLSGTL